jgi:hypothetical protein
VIVPRPLVSLLLLCALALAGCGAGDRPQEDTEVDVQATEAALTALERELAGRDGILGATATYDRSTGVALPSQLYVVAEVPGADPDAARRTVEEVTRATWDSGVPSISTLIVEVVDANDTLQVSTADVYGELSLDREQLTELFGPREG